MCAPPFLAGFNAITSKLPGSIKCFINTCDHSACLWLSIFNNMPVIRCRLNMAPAGSSENMLALDAPLDLSARIAIKSILMLAMVIAI
jgi:hypothetical protein|tara:strand:- start:29 stop:292 length:264 start_codon:yes stop_codon:yes gene_type:complete